MHKLRTHPHLNKGYGWRQPRYPTRRFPRFEEQFQQRSAGPVRVDLRGAFPAVYDQGALGSCTANAWGGLGEYLQGVDKLSQYVPSRLFIYYCERVREGDVGQDAGASLQDGAHVVANRGLPNEDLWPYDISKFTAAPSKQAYTDGAKHRVKSIQQVPQSISAMQAVLTRGLPIAIGFTVYDSFESVEAAATGVIPMPGPNEQVLGGHAVLVVGCDDTKGWWICRNSWGAGWGMSAKPGSYNSHNSSDGGYFTMPYAYLTNPQLAGDFWTAIRTL